MEANNNMAMREALEELRDSARAFTHQIRNSKYSHILDKYTCREQGFPAYLDLRVAIPKANAALSAPPPQDKREVCEILDELFAADTDGDDHEFNAVLGRLRDWYKKEVNGGR